jgi:hypothetical protein
VYKRIFKNYSYFNFDKIFIQFFQKALAILKRMINNQYVKKFKEVVSALALLYTIGIRGEFYEFYKEKSTSKRMTSNQYIKKFEEVVSALTLLYTIRIKGEVL